jgi:hypothetical protein
MTAKNSIQSSMTVSEALAEGFVFYGENGQENLDFLEDLTDEKLKVLLSEGSGPFYLSSKQPKEVDLYEGKYICRELVEYATEELSEQGREAVTEVIYRYEHKFDQLIIEIFNAIVKERASCTYEQTDIILKLA